jgi:hypothetical protein
MSSDTYSLNLVSTFIEKKTYFLSFLPLKDKLECLLLDRLTNTLAYFASSSVSLALIAKFRIHCNDLQETYSLSYFVRC